MSAESRLSLGARFAAAVERHGSAAATITDGVSLTYAQVAERVQGFADELQRRKPDAVAVLALASPDAWQAIMAAAVAGVPWVPIDERQPEAIVAHILRSSGAQVCVGFSARAEAGAAGHCDYVDGTAVAPAPWRRRCARRHAPGDVPAYVIYTSGSTGPPKGVMVGEAAIAGFVDWMAAHERLSHSDRVLQNHSIGFDNSIWEMLSPLAGGAALVFPTDAERDDYERLLHMIERTRVSVLNATPRQTTTLVAVADALDLTPFGSLRRLYTGAETVPHAAAEKILRAVPPGTAVANEYGPTEATITCTLGSVDEATLAASADEPSVPIGHPIGDALVQVRDGGRRCSELGDAGELWVGGRCVALGYRGLPEETAERFVEGDDGTRWYRTGDRVRLTAHGLVFLGRVDRQLNVRGHRIEPAAIESAAARLPGVAEAAAVPAGGVDGAYETLWLIVAAEHGTACDRAAVRAALERSLPYYMVPDQIVVREGRLPLTVNGKLDVDAMLAAARRTAPAGP